MKIGLVDVLVRDQACARDLYTGVLGLEVKTDAAHGESGRWLTVVSPEESGSVQLLLAPVDEAAEALQAARRKRGAPAVSFTAVVLLGVGGVFGTAWEQRLHQQTRAASGA